MSENTAPKSGMNVGKLMIYLLVVFIIILIGYKYVENTGAIDALSSDYTHIPEEIQIKYIPKEFNYVMDNDNAAAILANPRRYRRDFNNMVYDFNMQILKHVATRMDLPDSLMRRLEPEYKKHHAYLKQLYYNDFVALKDTSAALYETWYETDATTSADALNEVASKYTCFLVNHVISTLVQSQDGKIYGTGRKVDDPCLIATTEALRPMMQRLADKAAIDDFGRSKGLLEERVETIISELATMEIKDKKGLNKQLKTKVMGYSVSSTDIEVSAISTLKVGFKLDRYFSIKVSPERKAVVVILPEPEILSHEVYPKIDKLDVGWLREVSNLDLNKNFNLLRKEFRRDALESDVMDKAKKQADDLMHMMLEPLVRSINPKFKLYVRYKDFDPDPIIDQEQNDAQESTPIRTDGDLPY